VSSSPTRVTSAQSPGHSSRRSRCSPSDGLFLPGDLEVVVEFATALPFDGAVGCGGALEGVEPYRA
jgi:hypothetical protein